MRGHFEIENTAYPIGYLRVGEGQQVTDMRNLHPLHSQPIFAAEAVRIASEANAKIRSGELSLKDGDTSVAEFVAKAVALL